MMKTIVRSLFVTFICMILVHLANAQPTGPGPGPSSPVPIDGGLSLLIGGSVLYGVKKLKEKYKKDDIGK
jgi:hypothetical protein